jgi:hypothetical protein
LFFCVFLHAKSTIREPSHELSCLASCKLERA